MVVKPVPTITIIHEVWSTRATADALAETRCFPNNTNNYPPNHHFFLYEVVFSSNN
jgi:hypothetical protein